MYFRNYPPRGTCLDNWLKAPIWEDPSRGDMVNVPKHWFNHKESAFVISSDHWEGNWVAKVTLRDMKFFRPFLNTWLLMTGIPLLVETIDCKMFRCIYLKNKTFFLIFFCHFWICIKFRTFWKKDDPPSSVFRNYRPRKTRLDKCLKGRVWEARLNRRHGRWAKHWFNLNESAIITLIDDCEGNWVLKVTVRDMKCLNPFC